MSCFQETIRGNVATFTLAEAHADGTATWEVEYVGKVHRFTLDEWAGFGGSWCMWALKQRAAQRHRQRPLTDQDEVIGGLVS